MVTSFADLTGGPAGLVVAIIRGAMPLVELLWPGSRVPNRHPSRTGETLNTGGAVALYDFCAHKLHHPAGLIVPSTTLQALGGWKYWHVAQECPSLGVLW